MNHAQRGLTLVELLVAIFIFGLIASAAVFALRLAVDARDGIRDSSARIGEIETARMLMKEDLALVVNRPVRDAFGAPAGPAFLGGMETLRRPSVVGERLLLAFVRSGWTNPEDQAPRSTLQYVEYVVRDGALVRRTRAYLDDARGQPVVDRVLIADAADISVSFLAGQGYSSPQWTDGWPAPGGTGVAPMAVSLTVTTPRFGALRQYFWIGAGAPRGGRQ